MARRPLGYAGSALSILMRLVPRRHRFRTALAVAWMMTPLVPRTSMRREERARLMETPWDAAMYYTLEHMRQLRYDVRVRIEGMEFLLSAQKRGRGVLMIARHGAMSRAMVHQIHELGGTVIAAFPESMYLPGRSEKPRVLERSPRMFMRVRRLFQQGQLIAAMIDRWGPREPGDREFLTPHGGSLVIADQLIRLAVRCGASVLFFTAHAERDGLVMCVEPASSNDSVETVVHDFVRFVERDMNFVMKQ